MKSLFGASFHQFICIIEVDERDHLHSSLKRIKHFFEKPTSKIKLHKVYENVNHAREIWKIRDGVVAAASAIGYTLKYDISLA